MQPILRYTPKLRTELKHYLQAKRDEYSASKWGENFLAKLEVFSGSGKMLRGGLVCFSYQSWTGRVPTQKVIHAALALELAHSGLLIHDDIMDGDDLRRGQPSMHRQYQKLGQQKRLPETDSFGVNMALCGGDIALVLACELLIDTANLTVMRLFMDQLIQTCGGQMQDIYLGATITNPTKQDIYSVMEQKTAGYTIAMPLVMGAMLAGKTGPIINRLHSIGMAAGIIFQIRDDELGAMGNQKQTGKPVGADIRENKKTLLRHYLTQRCSDRERRRLAAIFGNPSADAADIHYVQTLLRNYEIPQRLAKEVEALHRQASREIDQLPIKSRLQLEFHELLDFCSQRQF